MRCRLIIFPILGALLMMAAKPSARAEDKPPIGPPLPVPAANSEDTYELMKLFVDTLDQVERNYVKGISRRELVEAAIQGMISKLDQHTNYISPEEIDRFKTGVESEFGGIGIHVATHEDGLNILAPVVGSPAYRAGLVTGDIVTHVGDKPLKGTSIDDAIQLLKGKAGTSVAFSVRRKRDGSDEKLTLKREVVRMETVSGFTRKEDNSWEFVMDVDGTKIGYIRIASFARHTVDEVRTALRELEKQEVKSVVLDMRFNPGGLLSSAVEISDMLVPEGLIVRTAGRNVEEKRWEAHKRGTFEDLTLAVLVNRGSASASEIVAACLQDHKRAVVIGERTWGKGSVQNVIELEGGQSALKLTTAKYYRPSGKDIHRDPDEDDNGEWGVLPDEGYELKLRISELQLLADSMRIRERLRGSDGDEVPPAEFIDAQLKLATDYLREKSAVPASPPAN